MDLKVDDAAMRALVSKAVLDAVTPETRDQILGEAVKALLSPSPNHWEKGKSPLKVAFDDAVTRAARDYAEKAIAENPAFQVKLKQLFAEVAAALFDEPDKRATLVMGIADKISQSLRT